MLNRRQVMVWGLVTLLGASSALAAEVTGVWKGEVALPNGQKLPFVARLVQDGTRVTGKLDGIGGAPDVEVVNGKADGDTITFSGVRQIAGAAVTFNYTARAIDADTLDFTIVREDGAQAPLKSLTKRATD